jgi:hypothetical protein
MLHRKYRRVSPSSCRRGEKAEIPRQSGLDLHSESKETQLVNSEASLFWGLIFGSIGLGFFVYGKQQRAAIPLVCGIALMVFPYFVASTSLLVLIGLVLMAIPYFIRL